MSVNGRSLGITPADLTDRFWSKVDKAAPGGCWVWTGSRNAKGYGLWGYRGSARLVHRLAYEALVGPIPPTSVIDHLCQNTSCCNPSHLEAVSVGENNRRWLSDGWTPKTHCKRGHPLTPENLMVNKPQRNCRLCHNFRQRAKYAALKQVAS